MPLIAVPGAVRSALAAAGLVALGAIVGGAAARVQSPAFDVVTAHRIDLVDANGTVRLALHNGASIPAARIRGKTYPRSISDAAGIVMFDPAGDEVGGIGTSTIDQGTRQYQMIFDYGRQPTDGVTIGRTESADGQSYSGGISIADRLPYDAGPIHSTEGVRRIRLGNENGDAALVIAGRDGKPRIRIGVDRSDRPHIEVLDATGKVTRTLDGG